MGRFKLKQFAAGSCFSYILDSQAEALIIDPHISLLEEYAGYLAKGKLNLKFIVDTHTHADHFSLAAVLKKKYGAQVLMHEKAISSVADRRLKNDENIALGSGNIRALCTPGHTDDAISLYTGENLFTGDVLLIGSVGRTDFQNGSAESMFDTLQMIKTLPGSTTIFPGHDYNEKHKSSLAREKNENPFLKETDKETFVKTMRAKIIPRQSKRRGRSSGDDFPGGGRIVSEKGSARRVIRRAFRA